MVPSQAFGAEASLCPSPVASLQGAVTSFHPLPPHQFVPIEELLAWSVGPLTLNPALLGFLLPFSLVSDPWGLEPRMLCQHPHRVTRPRSLGVTGRKKPKTPKGPSKEDDHPRL